MPKRHSRVQGSAHDSKESDAAQRGGKKGSPNEGDENRSGIYAKSTITKLFQYRAPHTKTSTHNQIDKPIALNDNMNTLAPLLGLKSKERKKKNNSSRVQKKRVQFTKEVVDKLTGVEAEVNKYTKSRPKAVKSKQHTATKTH